MAYTAYKVAIPPQEARAKEEPREKPSPAPAPPQRQIGPTDQFCEVCSELAMYAVDREMTHWLCPEHFEEWKGAKARAAAEEPEV